MKPSQKHSDAIFYQIAADEVRKGTVDEGLLAKAAVKAEGDKKKAEALYIEWRVELLIEQAAEEAKAAAEEAKAAAAEAKKTKDQDGDISGWSFSIFMTILTLIAFLIAFSMATSC